MVRPLKTANGKVVRCGQKGAGQKNSWPKYERLQSSKYPPERPLTRKEIDRLLPPVHPSSASNGQLARQNAVRKKGYGNQFWTQH